MQDSLLYMQRQRYDALLTKRIEYRTAKIDIYLEAIDNVLEMEINQKAIKFLDDAILRWPKNEELWLKKIKYYHNTGNRQMIINTIQSIKKNGIYLTPEAQQKIAYWNS